jgi:hypothetical protein
MEAQAVLKLMKHNGDIPAELSLAIISSVEPCWLWHAHSSRNAWDYSTSRRYLPLSISASRGGAELEVEKRRVQGTTWWIVQEPGLLLRSGSTMIALTDVNRPTEIPERLARQRVHPTMLEVCKAVLLPSSHTWHVLSVSPDEQNPQRARRRVYKSYSEGGGYRLRWRHEPDSRRPRAPTRSFDKYLEDARTRAFLGFTYKRSGKSLAICDLHPASPLREAGAVLGDLVTSIRRAGTTAIRPEVGLRSINAGDRVGMTIQRNSLQIDFELTATAYGNYL